MTEQETGAHSTPESGTADSATPGANDGRRTSSQRAGAGGGLLWSAELELGIPLIDGQHRKLVDRLQTLERAIRYGHPRIEVYKCLDFLSEYTEEHFRSEEQLLNKVRYPDLVAHLGQHRKFRSNVARAAQVVSSRLTTEKSTQLVQSMVVHWYLDHIRGTDRAYVTYLRAQKSPGQT